MDISTDNPDHGFQFPGTFELSAMGTAERGLETELPRLLAATGVELLQRRELEAFFQRKVCLGQNWLPC